MNVTASPLGLSPLTTDKLQNGQECIVFDSTLRLPDGSRPLFLGQLHYPSAPDRPDRARVIFVIGDIHNKRSDYPIDELFDPTALEPTQQAWIVRTRSQYLALVLWNHLHVRRQTMLDGDFDFAELFTYLPAETQSAIDNALLAAIRHPTTAKTPPITNDTTHALTDLFSQRC